MICQETNNIMAHQLRNLAQSGLSSQEAAVLVQRLLEQDRAQKLPAEEPSDNLVRPLFGRQKAHLRLVQ